MPRDREAVPVGASVSSVNSVSGTDACASEGPSAGPPRFHAEPAGCRLALPGAAPSPPGRDRASTRITGTRHRPSRFFGARGKPEGRVANPTV
jgi:hypothetical protein